MTREIRSAASESELAQAYDLRYRVYVEEIGWPQRYADHQARTIVDPLDATGITIVALRQAVVVGTVRLNFLRDSEVGEYNELYSLFDLSPDERERVSLTTRFAVSAAHRRSQLGGLLACEAYSVALAHGMEWSFIDVDPGMVAFYEKMGFVVCHASVKHPEYGDVVVMRLNLMDIAHLTNVVSPFRYLYWKQKETIPRPTIEIGDGR